MLAQTLAYKMLEFFFKVLIILRKKKISGTEFKERMNDLFLGHKCLRVHCSCKVHMGERVPFRRGGIRLDTSHKIDLRSLQGSRIWSIKKRTYVNQENV